MYTKELDSNFESGHVYESADIYIPIGPACRPVELLKRHGLRKFATPLDWMIFHSLPSMLHLYRTGFADFLMDLKEDSTIFSDTNKVVRDITNNIILPHHFSLDKQMEIEAEEVRETVARRYKKTDRFMQQSEKIILAGNRKEPFEELVAFMQEFEGLYPEKRITLVNVRHVPDATGIICKSEQINDNLKITEYAINDTNNIKGQEWMGNLGKWGQILCNYELSQNNFRIKMNKAQERSNKIIIYGAGVNAGLMINLLNRWSVEVFAVAVTESQGNLSELKDIPVRCIRKLKDFHDKSTVIIAVRDVESRAEIRSLLEELHFQDIIDYNNTPFDA